MTDVATHFPPQTYSSSFFLNALGEEDGGDGGRRKIRVRDKEAEDSPNILDCFITKMFRPFPFTIPFFVVLVFNSLLLLPVATGIECVEPSVSRMRVFKSLDDFQANKIPFDPQNPNSTGNIISFENITEVLPINSFITLDAQHIRSILLDSHRIHQIDTGAFLTLKCVASLTLRNNTIAEIEKYMFRGLSALHELDFGENIIKEIPEHVFDFTPRLKKLNFTRNSIRHVRPESFYNLFMLEELDLSYNYLSSVPSIMFQYVHSLSNLQMGSNEFEQIDADKWSNLTKLKVLNLSDNELSSFDLANPFSFSSSLVELYVDDNYLTKLHSWGLRNNLPALKRIDISENPWACEDLIPIIKVLNDSRIDYRGPEKSDPNIAGISCNRTLDKYERKKWVNPMDEVTSTPHPGTTSSGTIPAAAGEKLPQDSIYLTNVKILDSIQNVHTIIVWLFVVVLIFIVIDIVVRTGWLSNFIGRRRRGEVLDNADVENYSLLQERF